MLWLTKKRRLLVSGISGISSPEPSQEELFTPVSRGGKSNKELVTALTGSLDGKVLGASEVGWHPRGCKGPTGGLWGCWSGLPLRLLTLRLLALAWFGHSPVPPGCLCAAGIAGARCCPGHKSSPKHWQCGGGSRCCSKEGPAAACFTLAGRQRAVLTRPCTQMALLESSAVWQQSPLWCCPEKRETEYIQHLAAAVALQSKAPWLSRMETGPLSNLMVLLELGMSL